MAPKFPAAKANDGQTAETEVKARSDAENLQIIEGLRGSHEALRDDRIRTEHTIKTGEQTLVDSLKTAKTEYGSDDLNKLREITLGIRVKNTTATDAYKSSLEEAQRRTAEIDAHSGNK
jgi:hypothetical protein